MRGSEAGKSEVEDYGMENCEIDESETEGHETEEMITFKTK